MRITKSFAVFLFIVAAATTSFSRNTNIGLFNPWLSDETVATLSETNNHPSSSIITVNHNQNWSRQYLPTSLNVIFDKTLTSIGFSENGNRNGELDRPDPSNGNGNANGYGNGCHNGTGNGNGYGCPVSPVK